MFEAKAHMRTTQLRAHGFENAHVECVDPEDADGWVVLWVDDRDPDAPVWEEYTAATEEEVQAFIDAFIAARDASEVSQSMIGSEATRESLYEQQQGDFLHCRVEGCMQAVGWRLDYPDGRSEYACQEHKGEFEAGGMGNATVTEASVPESQLPEPSYPTNEAANEQQADSQEADYEPPINTGSDVPDWNQQSGQEPT